MFTIVFDSFRPLKHTCRAAAVRKSAAISMGSNDAEPLPTSRKVASATFLEIGGALGGDHIADAGAASRDDGEADADRCVMTPRAPNTS